MSSTVAIAMIIISFRYCQADVNLVHPYRGDSLLYTHILLADTGSPSRSSLAASWSPTSKTSLIA